jgi:broad specificity phosphatase PhoE
MEHYLDWELCVVSPLQRTLQTAKLTVGAVRHDGAPIKFLATEMCRERITCCPADSRRPLSVCKKEFPEVDFSQVTNEQDVSWHTDKENDEQCKQRGIKFLSWLAKRPESCIAVVTHSGFLKRLFEQFGMGIASEDMEELHRRPANCEMRGLVLCAHRQFGGGSADLVLMPEGDFPRFWFREVRSPRAPMAPWALFEGGLAMRNQAPSSRTWNQQRVLYLFDHPLKFSSIKWKESFEPESLIAETVAEPTVLVFSIKGQESF